MFKINQLKAGVLLSYISTGVNMVVQLLYTPIMIQLLGQSEYGLYTLVGSVVGYLSLFSLGFSGAYMRFYLRYDKECDEISIKRLNGMFLALFLLLGIIAVVCGMIMSQYTSSIFGTKLTSAELVKTKLLMQILVVNIGLTFPSSIFDSMVSANEKFVFQRVVNLAGSIFNPLICLPLLFMGFDSVVIVTVTTLITIFKLGVNVWFCFRKLDIKFKFDKFDYSLLKEISCFSFFLFVNMIIDQLNWTVDKFILGRVSGTAAVAIYGVGAQINTVFLSFSTAISSVFAPRVNRIAVKNSQGVSQEFLELFTKVGRWQLMFLGLIASGFVFFGHYFVTEIYTSTDYAAAYPVALLLILSAMIPLIQNLGIEIQRAINKHKFRGLIYLVMAVLNTIISIPLAIRYGPIGSALGTAVSLLVGNGLIMNFYYHKALKLDMIAFWKSIFDLGKGLIIPMAIGIIIMNFTRFQSLLQYLLYCLIYVLIYCISVWYIGMQENEKNVVKKILKKR